jgi:hypothetical protein
MRPLQGWGGLKTALHIQGRCPWLFIFNPCGVSGEHVTTTSGRFAAGATRVEPALLPPVFRVYTYKHR